MVLVAAAALGAGELGEGVDGGAGVGVGIEADAALGADAAPLAGQQRAAEQVGPDRHAVEPPFVAVGPDAGQGHRLGEERELDRFSVHDRPAVRRKRWRDTNAAPAASTARAPGTATLVCPRCGSRTAVRVALAAEEMTEADLAAIEAAALSGEDLAEDG